MTAGFFLASKILIAQKVLGHLAHGIRAQGPQGVGLLHGDLIGADLAVFLARAGDLDAGREAQVEHGLEEMDLADGVDAQRLGRQAPGGGHEALGGQMKDVIGLDVLQAFFQGNVVLEVAFVEVDLVLDAADVVHAAPPPDEAADFHIGLGGQDVFRQVTSGKPGNARDKDSHGRSLGKIRRSSS
jgi:hypothetical protein